MPTYVLIAICAVCKRNIQTDNEAESEDCQSDSKHDPVEALLRSAHVQHNGNKWAYLSKTDAKDKKACRYEN